METEDLRIRVQKFPAWHTKAAPNGKCCEGYMVPSRVTSSQMWKVCWNKGRLCWKIAKLFYFCHLKKLVRPETFGPYHVSLADVCTCQNCRISPRLARRSVCLTTKFAIRCVICTRLYPASSALTVVSSIRLSFNSQSAILEWII